MHIVSEVEGRMRPGLTASTPSGRFSGGTVSGAPRSGPWKSSRSWSLSERPYAGAVGYFGFNADMDFCITIRTIVIEKDRACSSRPGREIVYDSSPRREYEETLQKASALLEVLREMGKPFSQAAQKRPDPRPPRSEE